MSDAARAIGIDELLAHTSWVRRLARALLNDKSEVDDVVQETILAAIRTPPRSRLSLKAWMRRVVANLAYNINRADRARARREFEAAGHAISDSTSSTVIRMELFRDLADALLELKPSHHEAVVLRFVDDMPPRQIAAELGIPVNTINSRIQRGLGELRRALERRGHRDGINWHAGLVFLANWGEWPPAQVPPAAPTQGLRPLHVAAGLGAVALLVGGGMALLSGLADQNAVPPGDDAETGLLPDDASDGDPEADRRGPSSAEPASPDGAGAPALAETSYPGAPDRELQVPLFLAGTAPTRLVPEGSPIDVRLFRHLVGADQVARGDAIEGTITAGNFLVDQALAIDPRRVRGVQVEVTDSRFLPVRAWARIDMPTPHRVATEAVAPLPEIQLRPAARLRGVIVDDEGTPIAGARVASFVPDDPGRFPLDIVSSGTDGSFLVRCRPDETCLLVIDSRRHLLFSRGVSVTGFDDRVLDTIVLRAAARVSGRLFLPEGADAGTVVSLRSKVAAGRERLMDDRQLVQAEWTVSRKEVRGTVMADGTFEVWLPPDQPFLAVLDGTTVDAAIPGASGASVVAPMDDLEIDLREAVAVRFHVRADRNPVEGASVFLRGPGLPRNVLTDEMGDVTVVLVAGSEYTAQVSASGLESHAQQFAPINRGGAELRLVNLELKPAAQHGTCSFEFSREWAEQIRCASLLVATRNSATGRYSLWDSVDAVRDGARYSVQLAPGVHRLRIRPGVSAEDRRGHFQAIATEVEVVPNAVAEIGTHQVRPGGQLIVRVIDDAGDVSVISDVSLSRVGAEPLDVSFVGVELTAFGTTRPNSIRAPGPNQALTPLPPGTYTISVSGRGFRSALQQFEIREFETTSLEIRVVRD